MKLSIAILACLGLTGLANMAVAEKTEMMDVMKKNADVNPEQALSPYANVELRHYTNTYYDNDDYLLRQEPSAHVVAQLGLSLYQGYADLYATLGAVKLPQTQQILQRRPQIELDIYPIYGEIYSLSQYTIVEAPFSESEYDPENADIANQGSVVTVGLAQTLKTRIQGSVANWSLRTGVDIWTKLYSRKQPRKIDPIEDEQFSLANDGASITDEEAEASSINGEAMAGLALTPHFASDFEVGVSVHLTTKQEPKYFYDESADEVFYQYKKETTSNYLLRLNYKLSERVSLINDLYHFHDGFFAGRMRGEDRRRLRNIARMQVSL